MEQLLTVSFATLHIAGLNISRFKVNAFYAIEKRFLHIRTQHSVARMLIYRGSHEQFGIISAVTQSLINSFLCVTNTNLQCNFVLSNLQNSLKKEIFISDKSFFSDEFLGRMNCAQKLLISQLRQTSYIFHSNQAMLNLQNNKYDLTIFIYKSIDNYKLTLLNLVN